jgi:hypothetical protein
MRAAVHIELRTCSFSVVQTPLPASVRAQRGEELCAATESNAPPILPAPSESYSYGSPRSEAARTTGANRARGDNVRCDGNDDDAAPADDADADADADTGMPPPPPPRSGTLCLIVVVVIAAFALRAMTAQALLPLRAL